MKVGLQIYSVRDEVTKDPRGTLQKVADLGYKYWETCHMPAFPLGQSLGLPAKEAKELLDANGVKIVGAHISSQTDLESLAPVFEYNAALEAPGWGFRPTSSTTKTMCCASASSTTRPGSLPRNTMGCGFTTTTISTSFKRWTASM